MPKTAPTSLTKVEQEAKFREYAWKHPQQIRRIQKMLVEGAYESLLASGALDPTGKSDVEIFGELLKKLREWTRPNAGISLVVDHRSTLLRYARKFVASRQRELAMLMYATWFEHWINSLMDQKAVQLGLSKRLLKLFLRQTGFDAKIRCFPILLKLPALRESHIVTILQCGERRNAFVHYKFSAHEGDDERGDERDDKIIKASESTVRYLQRYAGRHLYKNAKGRARRFLK